MLPKALPLCVSRGIVGISKHREERMTAIANYLSSSDLDFVFLQEIWSQRDYKRIRSKTRNNLPHAHYFHSGVLGSGVCILSKSPIADTGMLKYNLNGYAHKFYHGDWFGGKVVGLCKVNHRGLLINLYVTHLHAEYNRQRDIYLSHRICQAFEMSQYVKLTSETCDLAIVAGDFNTEPLDPPYNIILHNTCLEDAFDSLCVGATCGHPDNHYTSAYDKHTCPTGKRIDYVMFKVGRGVVANCKVCKNPRLKTTSGLPLSDHEPVEVVMRVTKSSQRESEYQVSRRRSILHLRRAFCRNVATPQSLCIVCLAVASAGLNGGALSPNKSDVSTPAHLNALTRGQEQLMRSLDRLYMDRVFYIVSCCFMVCVLAATLPMELPEGFDWVLVVCRTVATLLLGFCLVMGFFWNAMEKSSLLEAHKSMRLLCRAYINMAGQCF
ncbi:conserved hypothetical protein, partial [Ixodes scapularis]